MIVHRDLAQHLEDGTANPEWLAVRIGRLTSSRVSDVFATLKSGGEAAGRRNLRLELALERITGVSPKREFVTQAMREGNEREPEAVMLYQAVSGTLVDPIGFVQHDTLLAGYSPDGIVGEFEGLIEVKCPEPAAHCEYLAGKIPGDYMAQIVHALWLTGAGYCDFISYQPFFPDGKKLVVKRVERDDAAVAAHDKAVRGFLDEVDREIERIGSLKGAA